MNTELLTRVGETIVEHSRQFDMTHWYWTGENTPRCGTIACIAGWGIALSNQITPLEAARLFTENFGTDSAPRCVGVLAGFSIERKAQIVFDISRKQADRLFFMSAWPIDFRVRYTDELDRVKQAQIAKERIEFFIKTNGTDIDETVSTS